MNTARATALPRGAEGGRRFTAVASLTAAALVAFVILAAGGAPPSGAAPAGSSSTTASTTAVATATVTAKPTTTKATSSSASAGSTPPGTSVAGTAPARVAAGGFPAPLVAPVPPAEGGPELSIADLYQQPGPDATTTNVVIRYRAPFALPATAYRASVLVGDPGGVRLRASFVSTGAGPGTTGTTAGTTGATKGTTAGTTPGTTPGTIPGATGATGQTTGIVETSDGSTWRDAGTTTASFDPAGTVTIAVPLASAPPGGAVWAEIVQGQATTPTRSTPFYSRDAFFGTVKAGTLPTSSFGVVTKPDGTRLADVAKLPEGPLLSVVNQSVSVTYDTPPPLQVLGQNVTQAIDSVQIAPSFEGGAVVTDFVRINRSDGSIGLYDGFNATPIDRSGDRAWLRNGLTAGSPGAPVTVTFDLRAITSALALAAPDNIAFGLSRTFVLADGSVVTAAPVLGTSAWFNEPPKAATTSTAPTGTSAASSRDQLPLIIGAVIGVVVVFALLALLLARRRRSSGPEPEAEPGPVAERASAEERADQPAPAPGVEADEPTPTFGAEPRPGGVVIAGEAVGDVVARETREQPAVPTPSAPQDEGADAAPEPEVEPSAAPVTPPEETRIDPGDALAAFDREFDEMKSRLRNVVEDADEVADEGDAGNDTGHDNGSSDPPASV